MNRRGPPVIAQSALAISLPSSVRICAYLHGSVHLPGGPAISNRIMSNWSEKEKASMKTEKPKLQIHQQTITHLTGTPGKTVDGHKAATVVPPACPACSMRLNAA